MLNEIRNDDYIGAKVKAQDGRSGTIINLRSHRKTGAVYAEVDIDGGGRVMHELASLVILAMPTLSSQVYEATPMLQPTLFDETPYIRKARGEE